MTGKISPYSFLRWILRPATTLTIVPGCAALFLLFSRAYPFLAVPTQRVPAEVLIVEGWIYGYGIDAAATEYSTNSYTWVATSGTTRGGASDASYALATTLELMARGVPESRIATCPAPETGWNRTSASARAVREQLAARGIRYGGVNIVTIGPHARQTRLAYRRIMGPGVRVGIITVPKQGLDTGRWWASAHGWKMVVKDFAGWFKECIFGYRK